MSCKSCTKEYTVFNTVSKDDNEYFIESVDRSAWSIIAPLSNKAVTNLFRNGSMESEFDPSPSAGEWFPIRTGATDGTSIGGRRVTTDAFSGVYSLEFYDLVQAQPAWLSPLGNLFPRTAGVTYYVSMMVKTCCGSTVRAGIFNATDGWMAYGEVEGTGCWQQLSFSFRADIGPSLVSDIITSYLTLQSALQCTTNYVDLITVVSSADGVTDSVTPFDGDSGNASWNGVSHLSTSTMAALSRTIGIKTPLNDLDFNAISYLGHGVPPVNQPTTQYARRNGAYAQRARANPRILTITGEVCGDDFPDLEDKREALINALGLNLPGFGDCSANRDLQLAYECVDECGDVSGKELRINVNYTSGLEGARTRPYCERMTIVFTANEDPLFSENRQYCKTLTPGTTVTVKNCGNAYASVKLIGRNRGTLNLKKLENLTTGKTVEFSGAAGYTSTPTSDIVFTNAPGNTTFVERIGATSTNLGAQMLVNATSRPTQLLLAPGENQIRVTGSVTGLDSAFVFCWRNKFLSSSAACGDCDCDQP